MNPNPRFLTPRVLAVGALMAVSMPAFVNESVYTPTKGRRCVTTSTDSELASWHCPGAGEYRACFDDTGGTLGVSFSRGKIVDGAAHAGRSQDLRRQDLRRLFGDQARAKGRVPDLGDFGPASRRQRDGAATG